VSVPTNNVVIEMIAKNWAFGELRGSGQPGL
jgi:hypothetical protein